MTRISSYFICGLVLVVCCLSLVDTCLGMWVKNEGLNKNKYPPRPKFTLGLDSHECGDLDITTATSLFQGHYQNGVRHRLRELKDQNEFNSLNYKGTGLFVIFEFNGHQADGPWIYSR